MIYPQGLKLGKFAVLTCAAMFSSFANANGEKGHSHATHQEASRHSDVAHVHGVGELEIVQDGNGLFISFSSPLANVLGFEHVPKTDTERIKARRVVSLLKANGLFSFSPDAQCKRTSHTLYSDILNPHSHGPADDHQHHSATDGHADFRASYEFECEYPAKLKLIEVRAFRQFPSFEKMEVQALFPSGQVGATLTLKKNTLEVK